jgi:hypothetical protein
MLTTELAPAIGITFMATKTNPAVTEQNYFQKYIAIPEAKLFWPRGFTK